MRKFLLNTVAFVMLLVAFYGFVYGRYCYQMNHYSLQLPAEKHVLLVGESQAEAAVNDSLIPCLYNSSKAADRYMTMCRRMEAFLRENPQIDTVIISVTPHSVARWKDEFLTQDGYIQMAVKTYGPLLILRDWCLLLTHNPSAVMSEWVSPIGYYWDVNPGYVSEYGHYDAADVCHLAEDVQEGGSRFKGDLNAGNEETLFYLHEMVNVCEQRGIKVIALSTPVYHASEYLDIDNYKQVMKTQFPKVKVWDCLNDSVPDEYRRDINHLNREGAEGFTFYLVGNL